jgi:lysozyme
VTYLTPGRWAGVRLSPRLVALVLPLALIAGPLLPQPQAAGRIQGIDTSKYQHDDSGGRAIDWSAVKRSGQRFAFLKASGHADRVDPWFARDWAAAGKAGMIRGAYHYADPATSPIAQADRVIAVVGSTREANNLGIVLDLESTGGLSPSALVAWAHAFLDRVQSRTGRTPILYTYVSFWANAMGNNRGFGAYPLWLARYGPEPRPLAGWNRWTFWQTSSSGRIPGIAGPTDTDVMCCSAATLAALSDGRSGPIKALWHKLGGASGQLGLPVGPEAAIAGGWAQTFEKGYIASTKAHGTHAVLSPLWTAYQRAGAGRGSIGIPTQDSRTVAGVTRQTFTGGWLVWSKATGAHPVVGATLVRWGKDGDLKSPEGLPINDRKGAGQQFQHGGLYVTRNGVHLVPGALRDRYESDGGTSSTLGLPTSDAEPFLNGQKVTFDGGVLIETTVLGQTVIL